VLAREYRRQLGVEVRFDAADPIRYLRCRDCELRYFTPALAGTERFYAELQRIPWYYSDEKAEFAFAARRITPEDRVLEIGAGRGAFARRIHARSYHGLEFSGAAIATARSAGIELSRESIEQHAIRYAGRYDVVCAFQVLEHVEDAHAFVSAAVACARTGGRLIFTVPAEDSFMAASVLDVLNMPPHHLTRWTDRCLAALAPRFGLEIETLEHEPLADAHVRLFARCVAQASLARLLGGSPRLLDVRLRSPLAEIYVRPLAALVRRAFREPSLRPAGHTVMAVYVKRG
jgi:SAM-dependent methyltransferase